MTGFMNLNSEQLAFAANFWQPTSDKGTAVAAEDSITSKLLDLPKSIDSSTSLSSSKLLQLLFVVAANFRWSTCAEGIAVAAADSNISESLVVCKSHNDSTSLSSPELLELVPVRRGTYGRVKVNGTSSSSHTYDVSES